MSRLSRRAFAIYGLFGSQALLVGCGGGANANPIVTQSAQGLPAPAAQGLPAPAAPGLPAPAAPEWNVRALSLVIGSSLTIDLSSTLPPGTRTGGTFEVDTSGAALPQGVRLSANGLLTVDASAGVTTVERLVFAYIAP